MSRGVDEHLCNESRARLNSQAGDKRSKLRSPGSEGQVLYTCRQQGKTGTIGNHDCGNKSDNNGYKDNSNREQGELLY